MNRMQDFMERFYNVKKVVEDMETAKLTQAQAAHQQALANLMDVSGNKRAAIVQRSDSLTASEWLMWNDYVRALETVEKSAEAVCQEAQRVRDGQRDRVLLAHRESETWKTAVAEQKEQETQNNSRTSQRLLDELAVLRNLRRDT